MSFLKLSRRDFMKFFAAPTFLSPFQRARASTLEETSHLEATRSITAAAISPTRKYESKIFARFSDGPQSPLFRPLPIHGNKALNELHSALVSEDMKESLEYAPTGTCTAWGIPFCIDKKVLFIKDDPVSVEINPFKAKWLVFLHTTDVEEREQNSSGFYRPPFKGEGRLGEHIADYGVKYADGTTVRHPIKRRHQISMFKRIWGENSLESVAHHKPFARRAHHEQMFPRWGQSQTRVSSADRSPWINWLWAWENPHAEKPITGFEFKPVTGSIILSAVSAGNAISNPLRWQTRRKATFTLPEHIDLDTILDSDGLLSQVQLDMGQIISAMPRYLYPNSHWAQTYNSKIPEVSKKEIILEYSAHPNARFHLHDGSTIPVTTIEKRRGFNALKPVARASQRVQIRVVEKQSKKPVAVKLHIHGEAGEYLAPVDRHRLLNPAWFEDYSVDYINCGLHNCTYIPGETSIYLPVGKVYIEVSKGFEIKPVREVFDVTPKTKKITIELEKILPWREKGWVTADTHVHFLSPSSAQLEGAGEGVNVINLLASQWGELMTNVGDFDGKTTYGSKEAGGDGEYLVRVGTENRQHVLGHISLLGYEGQIITPLATGGPNESALGDPIEILLTEWAQQCKKQGGVVILPHFPDPRSENAASIISGNVDGVEISTPMENLYGGISPYSLSDWYRYLNCGYFVPAVGGTDKMTAATAVGAVRTYAKIDDDQEFDYGAWKEAIRKGHTFVTHGPLIEFSVDGHLPGSWIKMSAAGGTIDVTWKVASVTVPLSRAELIINGEVKEGRKVQASQDEGHWSVKIGKSSWMALLVRGHYRDKQEIIAAHSSPVMIQVKRSEFFAVADAVTILEQIEGALAYLDTVGTRAEDVSYKRMRLILESAHRKLHNRMHHYGMYHSHTPVTEHYDR